MNRIWRSRGVWALSLGFVVTLAWIVGARGERKHTLVFEELDEIGTGSGDQVGNLEPGETVAFRLEVPDESYLYVGTEQEGVDLIAQFVSPSGEVLREVDGPGGGRGQEVIALTLERGGSYSLRLRAKSDSPPGRYITWVGDLRPRRSGDAQRAEAEGQFALASQLEEVQTGDSRQAALELYRQATRTWRDLSDQAAEASTYGKMGTLLSETGQLDEAVESARQGVAIWRTTEDSRALSTALNNLGLILRRRGEYREALDAYEEALALDRKRMDTQSEARVLSNMGYLYEYMGEFEKAEWVLREGLALQAEAADPAFIASLTGELGWLQAQLGNVDEAFHLFDQADEMLVGRPEQGNRAMILRVRAATERGLGRNQRALDSYQEVLVTMRRRADRASEASVLTDIGGVLADLGRFDEALSNLEEARSLSVSIGDRVGEIRALRDIGRVSGILGRGELARRSLQRALDLSLSTGSRRLEAVALETLGAALLELGSGKESVIHLNRALELWRQIGSPRRQAQTLRSLGEAALLESDAATAASLLTESLQLARSVGARATEAEVLFQQAVWERRFGDLRDARSRAEEGIDVVEGLRIDVVSDELRASFLASRSFGYELLIEVLMELETLHAGEGFAFEALKVSEKSRARSLLDLLDEAGSETESIAESLLVREADLRTQISAQELEVSRWLRRGDSNEIAVAQRVAAERQLADSLRAYRDVQEEIRTAHPRRGSLVSPGMLDIETLEAMLGKETALIEYYLGEEAGFGWVVSYEGVSSYELPGRRVIEARVGKAYGFLTARNREVAGESRSDQRARHLAADTSYWEVAEQLSRDLLGGMANELNFDRWVVVPDGALHYLPFAALPDPRSSSTGQPLMVTTEVLVAPSVAVLTSIRNLNIGRPVAENTLAVLADPVFDSKDPRVVARTADEASSNRPRRNADGEFQRLRFSRSEAEEILRLVPEGEVKVALDFEASRDLAMDPELSTYRWLHFATHGVIDGQNPGLSGLVLSMVDENGEAQNGFLRLFDIYQLDLQAELVVLSGCQTALGQQLRGEGIVGLARGFMYAGVPRVLASLWDVQDKATRELMGRFYRYLAVEKLSPSSALRRAQQDLWSDTHWKSPYYWAPFVLQGLWES